MIRSAGTVTVGSGLAYHFTLVDGSGELDVLFLGRSHMAGLRPSTRIIAEGTVGSYDGKLALWNPRYAIQSAETASTTTADGGGFRATGNPA
jgi:hypothetical protein